MKLVLGTMTFSDQVDIDIAAEMLNTFKNTGNSETDTAYVYNKGQTEELLGELAKKGSLDGYSVAGKANPAVKGGLTPESVTHQITTSLTRTNLDSFDLYYLHSPDLNTDIRKTLACVFEHFQAGRFKRFALSNYAAWQVAEICEICAKEGWMIPVVYQGMYNALTRDIERELLPCLRNYDMGFYVYNPLAGGMLSGKHLNTSAQSDPESGRFATFAGYQDRYWKADYFNVIKQFVKSCENENIAPASAALRWMVHHSDIAGNDKNAIILGASSMPHLEQNIQACTEPQLPDSVVNALDEGWDNVRPACIKYFRP